MGDIVELIALFAMPEPLHRKVFEIAVRYARRRLAIGM